MNNYPGLTFIHRGKCLALTVLLTLVSIACTRHDPIYIGFLGGLSGRVADLGEAGRNGALLAVEELNAGGGIQGREIILLIRDDEQNPAKAIAAIEDMKAKGIDALIGPMTSNVAEAVMPTLDKLSLVTVSPTVTASSLTQRDDVMFRMAPSVTDNTRFSAKYDLARGARHIVIIYDLSNKAFSADWTEHYSQHFVAGGGKVVKTATITSGNDASYGSAVDAIAASRSDLILLVTNAVDTVRLAQMIRSRGLRQHISTSTWAATEHFIQLGGRTIDGVTLPQFFDRTSQSPRYLAFSQAFRKRFQQEPGFASVAAYDSTRAVLVALSRRSPQQSLKQALLDMKDFDGIQEALQFDRFGDAKRTVRMTEVRDGRFTVVE